jgi:hypothetical protein
VYVTAVGGTVLTTTGAGGAWASETGWADSGGGISPDDFSIPSWQVTTAAGCAACSQTYRNGPDVSANADFSFYVCADQTACTANVYGGTTFATPMWAGYMALVNEQAVLNGNPVLGFINPALYTIGLGADYDTDFHDIASGGNTLGTTVGYDLSTGWGSPNGRALIDALAGSPSPAAVLTSPTPTSTLTSNTVKFTWTAGTGVSAYDLHLSAVAPGGYDLYLSGHITSLSTTVSGLPFNGQKIYARLYSIINGATQYNDYTYTAETVPTSKLTSPAPGSTLTGASIKFTWSAVTGVSAYDLHLSAVSPGGYDLYVSGHVTTTSATVKDIPVNGKTIYARLYSIVNGVTYYNDYTYTAASLATLKYPAPSSTFTSTSVFFEWTAGGGVSAYDLHLSAVSPGGYDLYSSGHTTSTIKTVNGLPTNGETIYARLYSIIGGVTYYNDYTYKAK